MRRLYVTESDANEPQSQIANNKEPHYKSHCDIQLSHLNPCQNTLI